MTSIYTKLTPAKRSLFGYTQLWLAPDHILLLTSSRFAENYKRFSFADIQSIVITGLPPRTVPQIVMIMGALAWTSLYFTVDLRFFKWFFVVTGVLALLYALLDIGRGQRCRCVLHTRVSAELLAPVSRANTARTFLARLRPLIEAVQGSFVPSATPSPIVSDWQPAPPQLVSSPGYLPEVVFSVFLLNAIAIAVSVQFPKQQQLSGVLLNTLLCELLLVVVALLRRSGRDARTLVYVVMGLSILGMGFDYTTMGRHLVAWFTLIAANAQSGEKTPPVLTLFPVDNYRAILASSWRTVAGIIGLAACFFERRRL